MAAHDDFVYRFGEFELDPRERRLVSQGGSIALTPKVFDTLKLLVERAGAVVGKDELMRTIWPRGYVDDSNLGKHIWTIRRALGESAGRKYVETVSKVGYRFVMPVVAGGRTTPGPGPGAQSPAEPPSDCAAGPSQIGVRRRSAAALVAAAVLGSVLAAALWAHRTAAPPRNPAAGKRIALIGFRNLSQDLKADWLAFALKDMLGTELGGTADLQIVPEELVRDASKNIAVAAAGGYAPQTLARLGDRLDADFVVTGGYLANPAADDPGLRVDLEMQDVRTGVVLASLSRQGRIDALSALLGELSGALLEKLGAAAPAAGMTALIAHAQPPTAEVARHMGVALDALRHFDPALARDELLEAVALAPAYAPAYDGLAQAWSALGYRQKALAAAEQAARHAGDLPPELRLQIQAAVQSARYERQKAAATFGTLVALKPLSVEYRLQYLQSLIAAASMPAAQAALAELRRLPAAAGDPRIALAAADLADAQGNPAVGLAESQRALRDAARRDSSGLIADARLHVAFNEWHLSRLEQADAGMSLAIQEYHALNNPLGEARARSTLAAILVDLRRAGPAREEDQLAMSLFQRIGDLGGVAGIYQHQGEVLWAAGDRDAAETAIRHALAMARELGDVKLQAWTLRALATITFDESATDEALADYREATALDEELGGPAAGAYGLGVYADAARVRGDLADAERTCARARVLADQSNDPQISISVTLTCALVGIDRGDAAGAAEALEQVIRRTQGSRGYDLYAANARLSLAQLDMDAGRWSSARDRLRQASAEFGAIGSQTGEANAQASWALCAQAFGDAAERDSHAARARSLRASINSKQEVFGLEIALARLSGGPGRRDRAIAALRDLAADAERRRWLSWSLEARWAAWRMLTLEGELPAAALLRRDIESTARAHGFERILALLHPAGPKTP